MFNPNLIKKQVMLLELYSDYMGCKGIELEFFMFKAQVV